MSYNNRRSRNYSSLSHGNPCHASVTSPRGLCSTETSCDQETCSPTSSPGSNVVHESCQESNEKPTSCLPTSCDSDNNGTSACSPVTSDEPGSHQGNDCHSITDGRNSSCQLVSWRQYLRCHPQHYQTYGYQSGNYMPYCCQPLSYLNYDRQPMSHMSYGRQPLSYLSYRRQPLSYISDYYKPNNYTYSHFQPLSSSLNDW